MKKVFCLTLLSLCVLCVFPVHAQNANGLMIYLNKTPRDFDGNVSPCFPVMARFTHPDSSVTRIRMRYPYDHGKYMLFPLDQEVHIELHENFMKRSLSSISDFIAEDDFGNDYGVVTLTFVPIKEKHYKEYCNQFLNS